MKCRALLLAALLLPLPLRSAEPLAEFVWKKRVALIATPALTDARYQQQAAELLPVWTELSARQLEIVVALPGDPRRARLAIKDDEFTIALVGLDGGLKFARREPITAATLSRELDSSSLQRTEKNSAERARAKGDADVPAELPAAKK